MASAQEEEYEKERADACIRWLEVGRQASKVCAKAKELDDEEKKLECYEEALGIREDHYESIMGMGTSLYNLGRYEEAIPWFDQTIEGHKSDRLAYHRKATSLHSLGRDEEALACLDRAITVLNNCGPTYHEKGGLLLELGRYEEAIQCYDQAIDSGTGDEKQSYLWKGIALTKLDRYEESISCYNQAIALDGKFEEAVYAKGQSMWRRSIKRIARDDPTYTDIKDDLMDKGISDGQVQILAELLRYRNTTLKTLRLGVNKSNNAVTESARNVFEGNNTMLASHALARNKISVSGADALADALCHGNTPLTELHLEGNELGDAGAQSLANVLRDGNAPLETLLLGYNQISDAGAEYLGRALLDGDAPLTTLNLEGNEISHEGAKSLANVLSDGKAKLTSLNLRENRIQDTGARSLANALRERNTGLKMLNLYANRISDAGARSLANALCDDKTTLTELDLGCNRISDDGADSLAQALSSDGTKLKVLNLGNNCMNDEGVERLSNALRYTNSTLAMLGLGANNITEKGVAYLSNALRYGNTSLIKLILNNNPISIEGAESLAGVFRNGNTSLTSLSLRGCEIGSIGAESLANALGYGNETLETLDLGDNKINEIGADSLANFLYFKNKTMTRLDLSDNNIESNLLTEINELLVDPKDRCSTTGDQWQHNFQELPTRKSQKELEEYRRFLDQKEREKDQNFFGQCSLDEFELGRNLGSGGFGKVYKGTFQKVNLPIAVKVLDRLENATELVTEEVSIQKKLTHRNVIRVYAWGSDAKKRAQYVLMEYMEKGSLRDVLMDENEKLSWGTKEQIAWQIAKGLAYVHRQNIAHKDLKSPNVLLGEEYRPKLCDFGVSITQQHTATGCDIELDGPGSTMWAAPESFEDRHKSVKEMQDMDIYALGVIMWELCTGELPKPKSAEHCPDQFPDKGYPPYFIKLAQECCSKNPGSRPSAHDVAVGLYHGPRDTIDSLFPEGISNSKHPLMKEPIDSCEYAASLYSLKRSPIAPTIFRRLIKTRSCLRQSQEVNSNGWRVYFKEPVDVNESDLEGNSADNEELNLLRARQAGDKMLLLAAYRWKKQYDTSQRVTGNRAQRGHGLDPKEFLQLFFSDQKSTSFDIYSSSPSKPLSMADIDKVFTLLDDFGASPGRSLVVAYTTDSHTLQDDWLVGDQTYSVLEADSLDATVTVAHPNEARTFTIEYYDFAQNFCRLASLRLSDTVFEYAPTC